MKELTITSTENKFNPLILRIDDTETYILSIQYNNETFLPSTKESYTFPMTDDDTVCAITNIMDTVRLCHNVNYSSDRSHVGITIHTSWKIVQRTGVTIDIQDISESEIAEQLPMTSSDDATQEKKMLSREDIRALYNDKNISTQNFMQYYTRIGTRSNSGFFNTEVLSRTI